MKIPVACALDQEAARSQVGEWQDVLQRAVARSERVSPNRLELTLVPNYDIGIVVKLAQREVACCPFFTFTVEIGEEQLVFVVEVLDDAVEVLDQLVSSARRE